MSECDNCLCHLHVCEAECCKEFRIKMTNPRHRYKKGDVVFIKDDSEDFHYYAKLRGFPTIKGVTHVLLDDFKQIGHYLYIYSTCYLLNDKNMCSAHNTPAQPLICKTPNKDDKGGDKIYLTKRCIYK